MNSVILQVANSSDRRITILPKITVGTISPVIATPEKCVSVEVSSSLVQEARKLKSTWS